MMKKHSRYENETFIFKYILSGQKNIVFLINFKLPVGCVPDLLPACFGRFFVVFNCESCCFSMTE